MSCCRPDTRGTNTDAVRREGKASLTEYLKILHADRPLGEAFDIANEAQAEDDAPKFVVAGHVAPRVEQGAYKITFSELGRPPN